MIDTVFGISDHLSLEDIRIWAKSLAKTGFRGDAVLFAYTYDLDAAFVPWCASQGLRLIDLGKRPDFPKRFNKERWHHYADFIAGDHLASHDRVIVTDVRDLAFQTNPSRWLDEHLGAHDLVTSSEGITYEHEAWNRQNALDVYGLALYERHFETSQVICAGLVGGYATPVRDLCLAMAKDVYQKPVNPSDQVIFNGVLRLQGQQWKILATNPGHDFGVHLSVMAHPHLAAHNENGMAQVIDGAVCNPAGRPYTIIHQYDRMKSLQPIVDKLASD